MDRRRRVSFSSDVAVRLEAMRDDFSHDVHDMNVKKQFHPTRFPRFFCNTNAPCSIAKLLDAADAMRPVVAPLVEVFSDGVDDDTDVEMADCPFDLNAPSQETSFESWEEIDTERWWLDELDELVCMEAF